MITEILENVCNDAILDRNSEALRKRYGKLEGAIEDLVFEEALSFPEILAELKRDTRRYFKEHSKAG